MTNAATYLCQQHRLTQIRGDYQAQFDAQRKTSEELQSTQALAKSKDQELTRLRKNEIELTQLRNEVGSLRQQQQRQQIDQKKATGSKEILFPIRP